MVQWISPKAFLPLDGVHVIAKNPYCEAESWRDGFNEIGKPSWCHKGWEHADDFVTHWRFMEEQDTYYLLTQLSHAEPYPCPSAVLCRGKNDLIEALQRYLGFKVQEVELLNEGQTRVIRELEGKELREFLGVSQKVRSRTPFRDDMKNCDLICMMDVFLDKEGGGEFNSSPVYFDRVQKQYVCIVKFETMPLVIYAYGETMEGLSEDLQSKLKGIVSK